MSTSIACPWCSSDVKPKRLQWHLKNACLKVPPVSSNEHICSVCNSVKFKFEFPHKSTRKDGIDNTCKACHAQRAISWRAVNLHHAVREKLGMARHRPGRWSLRPCEFCGHPFNSKEMRKHLPFCENNLKARPERVKEPRLPMMDMEEQQSIRNQDIESKRIAKHNNLVHCYGISIAEYERMVAIQQGCCAICKKVPNGTDKRTNGLVVDHDHGTGKIRRLLCWKCNHGIGNFDEDPALLLAAIAYLAEFKPIPVVA